MISGTSKARVEAAGSASSGGNKARFVSDLLDPFRAFRSIMRESPFLANGSCTGAVS
jgi:hypothetical protein